MSRSSTLILISIIILPLLMFLHLSMGDSDISMNQFWDGIFNYDKSNIDHLIIRELRFPRVMTALLAGSSLAVSGMLLQTILQNPLAGPYILGINSGASLMVALFLLSGISISIIDFGIIGAAMVGSFFASLLMVSLAGSLKSQISLILSGIMFGSFTSAIVTVLQSSSSSESLKVYTLWTMGSLQKVEFDNLWYYAIIVLVGILIALMTVKFLNVLVLGEKAAKFLGVHIPRVRILVLSSAAILAGITTAFCGPIAFVGMAIPNLVRILFHTQNHLVLLIANILFGAIFLIISDIFVLKFTDQWPIPLNALTSLIGAPFILYILIRKVR